MKWITRSLAAVVVWGLCVNGAQATPISLLFLVEATSGPLAGTRETGTFTFDDSIIPVGGGLVFGTDLLTDLDFTWGGITYDETTATTGFLRFDFVGSLISAHFGSDCSPTGSCFLLGGTDGWWFGGGFHGGDFSYTSTVPGFHFIYYDNPATLMGPKIPEPATLLLFGLALGSFAVVRRRKVN
jgi:hypothetical protein